MNQIATETEVMVVTGFGRIYLTKQQAEIVSKAMDSEDVQYVEIPGKGKFKTSSIHGVSPASQLEDADRLKKGDFKCRYGTWHDRGKTCACAEARAMGLS